MKNENRIFKNLFLNDNVTMVTCENLEAKTTFLAYLLHEYGILDGRELLCYTFDRKNDYYYRHLLGCISKIDKRILAKYLYPWMGFSHNNTEMINRFYFVSAIEKVQQSNLFLIDGNVTSEEDTLDSILNLLEFDTSTMIVIEDFDLLLTRTKYHRKEVIRKIKESSKKYEVPFILINHKKSEKIESDTFLEVSVTLTNQHKKIRTLHMSEYQNQTLHRNHIIAYDKDNYEIVKI